MARVALPLRFVLLTMLRSFPEDLYGVFKVRGRQVFQRLPAEAGTDPTKLTDHPAFADITLVCAQ